MVRVKRRIYKVTPRWLFYLGVAILVVAVAAELLMLVSNLAFLSRNYPITEIAIFLLAVAVVILVPIVEAVYGANRLMRIAGFVCFLHCASVSISEQYEAARHQEIKDGWQVAVMSQMISKEKAQQVSWTLPILVTFVMIELLGRLAGLGIEIMYEAKRRKRKFTA